MNWGRGNPNSAKDILFLWAIMTRKELSDHKKTQVKE